MTTAHVETDNHQFVMGAALSDQKSVVWDSAVDPHLGLYGIATSGKSNLACQVVRQALARAWDVRVIEVAKGGKDYHWSKQAWVAGDPNEAVFILADVDRMLTQEKNPPKPVLLVVDEASYLVAHSRQEGHELIALQAAAESIGQALANGAAKDIHVVLAAQKRPTKWRTDVAVAMGRMSSAEATANLGHSGELQAHSLPPGVVGGRLRRMDRSLTAFSVPFFLP